MNNKLQAMLLVCALPFSAQAAQELSPWYLGAGLGLNNYEPNCDQKTMRECGEDEPYAWDLFAGYLFSDNFSVELGYRELGRAEWTDYSGKLNDVGAHGVAAGLVTSWPLFTRFTFSAEAGAMHYLIYNNKQWGSEYYSDNGIAPYIGVGLGYQITDNLKVQAKYRRYENLDETVWNTLEMESNYYGLALLWRFGSYTSEPAPAAMAPMDDDNDGVNNEQDQCPDTPATHLTDAMGCTQYHFVEGTVDFQLDHINFENDSDVIKEEHHDELDKLASYMKENERVVVELAGHSSNIGDPDYNMQLSDRRANAVRNMLIEKYGITGERITAKGYGVTQPVAQGNNPQAHSVNRRIEAHVSGEMKKPILK
ncbi:OmpA family protein [Shewanella sp. AS1]|uniref:OmpA family protein n=1 Tax=Shewanella sp. AS1 TaxID=2907626 RepID=UPI002DD43B12|nr:OmpA family protein [Shewanella sp. AS1]